jgi:hypothetical protein
MWAGLPDHFIFLSFSAGAKLHHFRFLYLISDSSNFKKFSRVSETGYYILQKIMKLEL